MVADVATMVVLVSKVSEVDTSTVAMLDSLTDSSVTCTVLHETINVVIKHIVKKDFASCIFSPIYLMNPDQAGSLTCPSAEGKRNLAPLRVTPAKMSLFCSFIA